MKRINLIFAFLFAALIFHSCAAGKKKGKTEYAQNTIVYDESLPPNQAMAKYLADSKEKYFNNPKNHFACNLQADYLATQPEPKDAQKKAEWKKEIGYYYLNGGRTEKAIEYLEEAHTIASENKIKKELSTTINSLRAIAYLRLGEQKNCISNHVAESCIIPISKNAVYDIQEPTRKAITLFEEILAANPDDLNAMFLLNIAYMNVGEFPAKVPPQYVIKPEALESEYNIGRFKNIAISLGLNFITCSGGAISEDFNNDGLLDIFATGWLLTEQVKLMINNGDGTFTNKTAEADLSGITGGLHCMQTDYNNDGNIDIFIPRGAWWNDFGKLPSSLLKNNGDGTFTDVTKQSGIWSLYPTQTAVFADFNNDGWLDIFKGNETRRESENYPNELFISNGDGTFKEMAKEAGMEKILFSKGVTAGDYDNDGDMDIAISAQGQPNTLFKNESSGGKIKFTDVSKEAGIENPIKSFPLAFFDYNNDGWQDLLICTYDAGNCEYDNGAEFFNKPRKGEFSILYKNNGNGTFTNVNDEMNFNRSMTVMGLNYGDIDNDGWIDLYCGTGTPEFASLVPNRMFRNNEGKNLQDVTTAAGVGHLQKGHGISFGDLDNDGDQDIYSDMGGGFEGDAFQGALFENPGTDNNWTVLKLVGVKANHAAIGSKVKVTAVMPDGNEQNFYHVVSSGSSFGANSLQLEIGLGKATAIKEVEITWQGPNTTQVFKNVPLKKEITLTEGNPEMLVKDVVNFQFLIPQMDSTHHHAMHM